MISSIGERLYAIRKEKGMNQKEFGSKIGVTPSAISNYENGAREISDQVILSVCREFEINEVWLRTGYGEQYAPKKTGIIDQLIYEYKCSKLEGDFIKTYFQMDLSERQGFIGHLYRLFAPLFLGLEKKNPFADYFTVTFGDDNPELMEMKAALEIKVENSEDDTITKAPIFNNPAYDIETISIDGDEEAYANYAREQRLLEKEQALQASSAKDSDVS